eukprot:TRINITY_DN6371_c0_g1_i5.p1 TRINITY_DN6371_c0_g1~~TRINITY_DN6371_c0_g1_i5.p1  ORF type:complete len:373 (+),score=99.63 TRINITY_DN6371_c0_g1_i5:299-1417(+)
MLCRKFLIDSMKMEIVIHQIICVERLEVDEVKENFVSHGLEVDDRALTRIFKSVAVDRKRLDPCNDLSLYEFSIFSKKASNDFKQLMNGIKCNMTAKIQREKNSALLSNKQPQGTKSILPTRRANYIKYLPADFNPLMNHFKDEEKRSDIRQNLTGTLDEVLKIGSSQKKLVEILENNENNMEGLLKSHFPNEELDEEVRRMFAQVKQKSNYFRFKALSTERRQPRLALGGAKEEVSEEFKSRMKKRLHSLVNKAKEQGRMEAKNLIQSRVLLTGRQALTSFDASSSRRSVRLKTAMGCPKTAKPFCIKPHIRKLLAENLVLRTATAESNSAQSPFAWRVKTANKELPLVSSFSARVGPKCFSSMSNREPLI